MEGFEKALTDTLSFFRRFIDTTVYLAFYPKKIVFVFYERNSVKLIQPIYFFLISQVIFYATYVSFSNNSENVYGFSNDLQTVLKDFNAIQILLILIPGLLVFNFLIKITVMLFRRIGPEKIILANSLYYFSGMGLLIWSATRIIELFLFASISDSRTDLNWVLTFDQPRPYYNFIIFIPYLITALDNIGCIAVSGSYFIRLWQYKRRFPWPYLALFIFCFDAYYIVNRTSDFFSEKFLINHKTHSISIVSNGDFNIPVFLPEANLRIQHIDNCFGKKYEIRFLIYNETKNKVFISNTFKVDFFKLQPKAKSVLVENDIKSEKMYFHIQDGHQDGVTTVEAESYHTIIGTFNDPIGTFFNEDKPLPGSPETFRSIVELIVLRPKFRIEKIRTRLFYLGIDRSEESNIKK